MPPKSLYELHFLFHCEFFCSFQNDSTPTTARTTTKLLLEPLSVARGQKIIPKRSIRFTSWVLWRSFSQKANIEIFWKQWFTINHGLLHEDFHGISKPLYKQFPRVSQSLRDTSQVVFEICMNLYRFLASNSPSSISQQKGRHNKARYRQWK